MASGKRALLHDDGDDAEEIGKSVQLGYNERYAQRFTHNKKREDLHRLQDLQKKGLAGRSSNNDDDDESSSEEEDDDGYLPARIEEKIFETLSKIKKRDPIIYSTDTQFFGDDDDNDDGHEERESKKEMRQKPLYLKDVNARQLLEGGDGDHEENSRKPTKAPGSYHSEQEELKRAFLQGVREVEGEEDDLLRVKKRTNEELEREALEVEEAVEEAEQRAKDRNIAKRLEEYFGKDDDLDNNDKFLKEYLLNKGWIDQDQQQRIYPTYYDDAEDISEDEEALGKQDQFEKDYNFRFQDGADNTYVKGHSRIIDDSVRKKSESRKKQRQKKKERESEEAQARREELKRLKNVKKKEVLEKLDKIRAVAGLSAAPSDNGGAWGVDILGGDDLDKDFDPDEYDKKMKEAFGEEYYGAEDPDFVDGDDDVDANGKPDFDAEDVLLGIESEGDGAGAGFAAVKAKLEEGKKKKKVKVPFEEKVLIDKHLEEYYKLDYEDVIGDLPTRFKYRPVAPNKYGLKTKDIIGLDDKVLNQYISLKKLVPYTTEEWKPRRPAPRLSSKARKKQALNSEDTTGKKRKAVVPAKDNGANSEDIRRKKKSVIAADDNEAVENVSNGQHANGEPLVSEYGAAGGEKPKKSRKRKKSGAPPVLPKSRLLSYETPSGKKKGEGPPKKKKVKRVYG